MPIAVKDYTWRESDTEVSLTLPLKGVKSSKADVFSTDQYIKVNYPPYLFEVHLFAEVIEEQCTAKVGNGVIEFRLIKKEPGMWGSLTSVESEKKEVMVEKRAEAVELVHKKAADLAEEKAKKKREEEQFAIRQQMKLEEEERERIEREKQTERDKAERELEEWKAEKRAKAQAKREADGAKRQTSSGDAGEIWKDRKTGKGKGPTALGPPPPRTGGTIQIHFTPRFFPTAARESKAVEEQEWLTKMAAARKIKPPDSKDESINERNPEFLKDKGIEFFKTGNYDAAINAFSEGIQLNPNLPQLFSNRAACFLATGDNDRCIGDCCRALELFSPVVPSNYASRTKVFVRRGTAYANQGRLDLALQDYNAAMKLSPGDEKLKEDHARLKEACLRNASEGVQ